MADIDANLVKGLKAAKGKAQFFAFIPKGPADGKLIVSKVKIKASLIAAARKEIGGGSPITGKCIGPASEMVFTTVKPAPGTLANCLKIVTKRDAGLPVFATFQLAADADEGEEEGQETEETVPGAPPAPPPPPVDSSIAGVQKALAKLGYNPGAADGAMGPKTKAAITKFQQDNGLTADGIAGPKTQAALARALKGAATGGTAPSSDAGGSPVVSPRDAATDRTPGATAPDSAGAPVPGAGEPTARLDPDLGRWTAAQQYAITALKALAGKVAATRHADAAGVCKEIFALIKELPAIPVISEIDRLETFIRTSEALTAAEQSPKHFHDLNIRQPLLDALESLKS